MRTPSVWKAPFQVNQASSDQQATVEVGAASDGTSFTLWTDYTNGGTIFGQKLDANGNLIGTRQLIAGGTTNSEFEMAVVAGNNVRVAWQTAVPAGGGSQISVGSFNSNLGFFTSVFLNASNTQAEDPSIAANASGRLLVTYTLKNSSTDWDIVGRIIQADGTTVGTAFTIRDDSDQSEKSRVAALDSGNFVVVLENQVLGSTTNHDIYFERRSETGVLVGSTTQVTNTTALETDADVAALHSGGFVVTWTEGTGNAADIKAQVYDASGQVVRKTFTVNTTTTNGQGESQVASMDDGGFLVTWEDYNTLSQRAQRFDGNGNKVGAEVQVKATLGVGDMSLATLSDGRTLIGYDDFSTFQADIYDSVLETRTNVVNHVTGSNFFGSGTSDFLIVSNAAANNTPGGLLTMYAVSPDGARAIGSVGSDWAFDAAGDTNGDGRSDIFAHNDVGANRNLYVFATDSQGVTAINQLGVVPTSFQVAGSGDFNRDGYSDLLLQIDNTANGQKTLYTLPIVNGAVQSVTTAGVVPINWVVDAIGNLSSDGLQDDILMHYDTADGLRHLEVLKMGNSTTQQVIDLGAVGNYFQIDGLGDFDGDGDMDILMHEDTATARNLLIGTIENSAITAFRTVGPIGKGTYVDGIGDFNGDGTADIGFHYDPSSGSRATGYIAIANSAAQSVNIVGATGHEWLLG